MSLRGNVRELGNILERMTILATGREIDMTAFVRSGIQPERGYSEAIVDQKSTHNLKDVHLTIITDALKQTDGNKAAAARLLGIDASTLWRKIKAYRLQ